MIEGGVDLVRRAVLLLFAFSFLLAGCHQRETRATDSAAGTSKSFFVRGKVIGTDATHVMLEHEAVPGFMDAMTMNYKLKDPSIVGELHPGDRITAQILVKQDTDGFHDPLLDDVVVIAQGRPDYKPPVQYHVPQAGDKVPDFSFVNQSGRTIHLKDFRGKVVLLTFIYTRCTLADYCPRMSRNFAEIDKKLAADSKLYSETHLISLSFDPTYDTPKVLRSYGGAYTGNYTKEKFLHWDFAAPQEKELPAVTQFFDVGVTPGDSRSLTHSLSTVLLGKNGEVLAWYPTNEWKPEDVYSQMKQAAAQK